MDNRGKRALAGMSGGTVDAACPMLREQGYEAAALIMRVRGEEPAEARRPAARPGIECHVADEREAFKNSIVRYFVDEYRNGASARAFLFRPGDTRND